MRFLEGQVKEWVCRRLGKGVVGVELSDDQIDDAILDAKIWWQSWVGQTKSVLITLDGGREYLGTSIASDIDSIVNVVFEEASNDISRLYSWAGVEIGPYTWMYRNKDGISDLVQHMQYMELMSDMTASDKDWEWDRSTRKLIVTPTPSSGSKALVTYISTDVSLNYLNNYEMSIFRKYALAQAMKVLAGIRMKFSEKPGATGGFSMDGDALWANAEAIENDMEEKARQLQDVAPFFAG